MYKRLVFFLLFFVSLSADADDCKKSLTSASDNETLKKLLAGDDKSKLFAFIKKKPNVDINTQDEDGRTVLMFASFLGNKKAVISIIENYPFLDVNIQDEQGKTALIYASYWARKDVVRILLAHPFTRINIQDSRGDTALLSSLHSLGLRNKSYMIENLVDIIKMLLDPKIALSKELPPILEKDKKFTLSLNRKAKVSITNKMGEGLITLTHKYGLAHIIEPLLSMGIYGSDR